MSGLITGTWEDVKLVCIYRHDEPVEMEIKEGPSSLFYACPKYYAENREEGERACNNRLNLIDYDKMIATIDKKRYEAEMNSEKINLKNYTWKTSKGIEYTVLSHEGDKLVIGMINLTAIHR